MKRLITNGLLMDGTGSAARPGSLAIENGRILAMGQIDESGFDDVLDAQGCVIAPGFIDTHSHSDLEVFKNPHLSPKLMQGITTEVLGQDGVSLAPLPKDCISPWRKNMAGMDGDKDDFPWDFHTTENYLKLLEKNGSGSNLAYLAPHGNVRMEARGLGAGVSDEKDLNAMRLVLQRELDAGCMGFSTGLIYMPCAYADTHEVTEMCKVAAKNNVPFVIHQRSEADTILDSMREVIAVGRDSGVHVHFSHFKLCGKNNAHLFDKVLGLLDEAKREGITVSYDQYPYVAGSTMLGVILPPWVHDGGTDMLLERLTSPEARLKMIKDIQNGIAGWDNFVAFAGLDGIFVTDVQTRANQEVVGKSLIELGQMRGKEPLQATFDLLYEEGNAVSMVDFYGLEEHVRALIARPEMNVCTDGILGGTPHPRVYGAFPRVLGKYVREEKTLTLPEAIRKMTSKPASVFGMKDRGLLKEGYAADITVFNPETIIDKGTFQQPRQFPEGILHVLVNGEVAVRNGQAKTEVLAGKVLRKQ